MRTKLKKIKNKNKKQNKQEIKEVIHIQYLFPFQQLVQQIKNFCHIQLDHLYQSTDPINAKNEEEIEWSNHNKINHVDESSQSKNQNTVNTMLKSPQQNVTFVQICTFFRYLQNFFITLTWLLSVLNSLLLIFYLSYSYKSNDQNINKVKQS